MGEAERPRWGRDAQRFHNKNKEIVIGIKQRGGDLRFFKAEDVKSGTLAQYIKDNVSMECEVIMTDELTSYPGAVKQSGIDGLEHKTVNHSAGEYVNGDITTVFVSMSARHPDGLDADYLQWHSLDNRPEQHRLAALRSSLRLVSTPACRAARAVSHALRTTRSAFNCKPIDS